MLQAESRAPTEIRLVHDWMGNGAGSKMTVFSGVAKYLISRGVARYAKEQVLEAKEEVKSVLRPPKDKMVHEPEKTKRLRSF